MRPIKDLFVEEYWDIAYRAYSDDDTVVNADKKYSFKHLKANSRYWYADPFLIEFKGETYLFTEMFDNIKEVGVIGCSKFTNGEFGAPEVVLEETFHLSYPYVFEKDGKIFMMPESHEDSCIQLYEAVEFPQKWKKHTVLVDKVNAVDTVIENGYLLASVICPTDDMTIDFTVYDAEGRKMPYSPVYSGRLDKRGAGHNFTHKGMRLRPAQGCENGVYGGRVIINKITQCDDSGYSEEEICEIKPVNIAIESGKTPCGIHTYGRTDNLEVVDIKFKRTNIKRLFWIIKKKLG